MSIVLLRLVSLFHDQIRLEYGFTRISWMRLCDCAIIANWLHHCKWVLLIVIVTSSRIQVFLKFVIFVLYSITKCDVCVLTIDEASFFLPPIAYLILYCHSRSDCDFPSNNILWIVFRVRFLSLNVFLAKSQSGFYWKVHRPLTSSSENIEEGSDR